MEPMENHKSESKLDLATVQKVASLARLKISDEEAAAIAGQLSAVLENFKQLALVNTTGVEPLVTPTELTVRLREDEAVIEKDIEAFIVNAPARSGNLFKVPPVVGG
jgi:aspartyl-tRNA(Asn)/glutamyl-tRNA(Gln) amidotransferase subunit C